MNLSETTKDVLKRIELAEQEHDYHRHLDELVVEGYIPVDKNFSYHWSLSQKLGYSILKYSLIYPYSWVANRFWLKTEVRGRRHLKSLTTGAIVCSNHVNKLDAVAIQKALLGKQVHYTVAEFNNRKSRLGTYMRAFGCMPIPYSFEGKKKFDKVVKEFLDKNHWITFFPEGSEWWCYEKPRPLQMGAYHFAAKYHVPILPIFITFKKLGVFNKEGIEKRKFILHILNPIFPKKENTLKENKEYLHQENEKRFKECYEAFYHKKLL